MTVNTAANKVRYAGRIIRTANKLRRRPVVVSTGNSSNNAAIRSLTNKGGSMSMQYLQNLAKRLKISVGSLSNRLQKLGARITRGNNGKQMISLPGSGSRAIVPYGGTVTHTPAASNNKGEAATAGASKEPSNNKKRGLFNRLFGGMKPSNNNNKKRGILNRMFGGRGGAPNKNVATKIEDVLKESGISNSDKVELIKLLLSNNTKRSLKNKKEHILRLSMNQTMKNSILNYLNNNKGGGVPPAPAATTVPEVVGGTGVPAAAPGKITTIVNVKDPLRKIASILASKNNTTSNSAKAETIIQILKDNPKIIRTARDLIMRSSLGRNTKDELVSYISDLLDEERNRSRYMAKYKSRNGNLFGRRYNNNNLNWNRNRNYGFRRGGSGVFNLGGGNGSRNVAFRKTVPFQPPRPSAKNVLRSSNFNRGGGNGGNNGGLLGNNRNNGGLLGNNRNNGGLLGNNRNNGGLLGNGTLPRNNGKRINNGGMGASSQLNFRNTFNIQPQQQQQQQKKRGRPVRMKLLKETVDNVKKNKLVKQIKKLGKSDGLKVITQKKTNIVKYIVKQIRPPAKKAKKNKKSVQSQIQVPDPLKANQQVIFKNTILGNGTFPPGNGSRPSNRRNNGAFPPRNGTRNQNVRQPNAQNTGFRRNNTAAFPS